MDKEVDGVTFKVALGPAPIGFFDDETGEGGQLEVARLLLDELEAAFVQERGQRSDASSADLFPGPALRGVVHGALGCWGEEGKGWCGGGIAVLAPMRLDENAVDLLEINYAGLVAHRFQEAADAQIARTAQKSLAGAHNERQRLGGEGVVAQASAVKLGDDECLDGFGRQAREHDGVSDPGADFLVDGQGEGLQERGLADENEVV
jgi:hypothetical protein